MIPFSIKPVGQKAILTINPTDDKGLPAVVDGLPVWTVVSGDVNIVVSEDAKTCEVYPNGTEGTVQVDVSVDADRGEGVRTISDSFVGTIAAGEAVSIGAGVNVVDL